MPLLDKDTDASLLEYESLSLIDKTRLLPDSIVAVTEPVILSSREEEEELDIE